MLKSQKLSLPRLDNRLISIVGRIEDSLAEEFPERFEVSIGGGVGTDSGVFCASELSETAQLLECIRQYAPDKTRYVSLGSGDGGEAFLAAMLGFDVTAVENDYELSMTSQGIESEIIGQNREVHWEDEIFDLKLKDFDVLYYFDRGCSEQDRLIEKIVDEARPGAIVCMYRQSQTWMQQDPLADAGFAIIGRFGFESVFEGRKFSSAVYERVETPFACLSV